MKRYLVFLILVFCILSCEKKDKLSVSCQGDCHNYSFKIGDETGAVTMNLTTHYTYDAFGSVSSASSSGTLTYTKTGNSYQVNQTVNYQTCKYTVEVSFEGDKSSCGN
jgi:hypothetical protein